MTDLINFSNVKPGAVALVGIPFDENSTFMRGAALAPARIREVLHAGACNLCSETGIDLAAAENFCDLGDIRFGSETNALDQIEQTISRALNQGLKILSLGGDHAVTYPILKAFSRNYQRLNILDLDAHPDLYEDYEGNRYSHACPFARIMEENLAQRVVQVGIRTINPHQRRQIARFGIEVIEMRQIQNETAPEFKDPLYLSIDLDVLDPAFAPGVSHHEPGGMSTREVIALIQALRARIVGADIVEFNPKRDPSEITAMVAVKLLKEVAARMMEA